MSGTSSATTSDPVRVEQSRADHRPNWRPSVWQSLLTCVGLTLAVVTIYGQVFNFRFVNFDDDVHVTENMHVTTGLTWENIRWDFGIHGPSQWHPLAWMSHQLDCTLFGLNPGAHHAMSVMYHLLAAILLFFGLQHLLRSWGVAAFVAAAFAVHPLNVESVAWISERRNVLCAVFFFLTIRLYAYYSERPTYLRYLLVLLGHTAALMSKPLAVTLPCVLVLLDVWPLRRNDQAQNSPQRSRRSLIVDMIVEKVPLFVLSAVASILTILCQHAIGTVSTFSAISLPLRLANAVAAYGWYIQKLLVPFGLGVFYPHPALTGTAPWGALLIPTIVGAVILIAVSLLCIRYRRAYPWLWFGWLWYLGVMVPMIGVMQVGEQQYADRYAYLPTIGLFIILAYAGVQVASRSRQWKSTIRWIGCLVLLGWGCATYFQASYWRNSISLFSHTIEVTTGNHWAHNNLGFALLRQGKPQAAAAQFQRAIQAVPRYGLAHYNLGVALQEMGQQAAARAEFETALMLDQGNPQAHQRLAAIQIETGEFPEAIMHFRHAARITPMDRAACFNLGLALVRTNQPEEAVHWLEIAHKLQPDDRATILALAIALRDSQRQAAAVELLKSWLKNNPSSDDAQQLLDSMQGSE